MSRIRGGLSRILGLGALIALAGSLLCACTAGPRGLRFEVLDQGDGFPSGRSYGEKEPDFLVIANRKQVDTPALPVQFPSELADQLRALNYDRQFAVIVLRGYQTVRTSDLVPETRQVVHRGNEVILRAHFGQIDPDKGLEPATSSPYQAIAVSKGGKWRQNMRFVLEVDGEEVKEREYFIP